MNRLRPHSLPAPAVHYRIAVTGAASLATRMRFPRRRQANARGDGVVEPCSRIPDDGGIAGRCGTQIHAVNTRAPDSGGDMHDLLSRANAIAGHQPRHKGGTMKRLLVALLASGALLLLFPGFAAPALAATTTPVSMTLVEAVAPGASAGCAVLQNGTGLCGHGQVIPYGQATETILFGGACGGLCDLRTITLAGGSITLDETFSNLDCPDACRHNPVAAPFSGTLTDVVVGGTGEFSGVSGNLSGSVNTAGPEAVIKLSGAITLP
jgi:hypothetical protein